VLILKLTEKFKWQGSLACGPWLRVPASACPHARGNAVVAWPPPATSPSAASHLPTHTPPKEPPLSSSRAQLVQSRAHLLLRFSSWPFAHQAVAQRRGHRQHYHAQATGAAPRVCPIFEPSSVAVDGSCDASHQAKDHPKSHRSLSSSSAARHLTTDGPPPVPNSPGFASLGTHAVGASTFSHVG
jgi:hypothetical protein